MFRKIFGVVIVLTMTTNSFACGRGGHGSSCMGGGCGSYMSGGCSSCGSCSQDSCSNGSCQTTYSAPQEISFPNSSVNSRLQSLEKTVAQLRVEITEVHKLVKEIRASRGLIATK